MMLSPLQSRHLGTSRSSPNHHQLPCHIFLNLIDGLKSSLSKVISVLEKARSHRAPNLRCSGAESHRWFGVLPKNCMRCEASVGTLSWWSCQSLAAHSCGLLNHLNSFCGEMFKLNTKFDADLLLYMLSHFECNSHTVHTLTQWCLPPPLTSTWNCHCSHRHMPVHSPWLPGYTDVTQTTLIILTMAGLCPDRPHIQPIF